MDKKKQDLTGKILSNDNCGERQQEDMNYWRSFKELYNDPAFEKLKEDEFGPGEIGDFDLKKLSLVSRRKFLALLSASAAFAAAGCSNYLGKGEIIPYNKKPEEIIIGIPNYYASTCAGCEQACGILVKTREGRPIKIDGNPDHLINKGKICARGQASILDLYDPGRLKDPLYSATRINHNIISWQEADEKIITELKNCVASGKEIAIITHKVISPTQKKLFDDFIAAYPIAKVYSYELYDDETRKSAWDKCYQEKSSSQIKSYPVIEWDKAKVILALESDFLLTEGNTMEQTRLFSQGRDAAGGKEPTRLYAVEGAVTLTGMNADYRIRLRTDAIEEFIKCLLNEFVIKQKLSAFAVDTKIAAFLQEYSLDDYVNKFNLDKNHIKYLVQDLSKYQGSSIVIAGNKLPESTHIAVNLLNEVLGNTKLYSNDTSNIDIVPQSNEEDLETLIFNMNSSKTGVVIHYDTNPVYNFAQDYLYSECLKKVPVVISFTQIINESADVSNYILPCSHDLECWGDFKIRTGIYSTQQPVISPIYRNRQKEAALLTWIKGNKDAFNEKIYQEYLISNWEKSIYPLTNSKLDFKKFWNTALHDGVVFVNEKSGFNKNFQTDELIKLSSFPYEPSRKDYVVVLQPSYNLGDGRFANNGFLQELPHPISKIVWDNYAAISQQTANDIGVKSNDLINISGNGRITIPVFIQPGVADGVIEITLGYGQAKAGIIGSGVGVNAMALKLKPFFSIYRIENNNISKAPGTYELVTTQEHNVLDTKSWQKDLQEKRDIIREGTYKEYKKNPKFLAGEKGKSEIFDLQKTHFFEGVKWGMSIDLNKCTGCSACVIACGIENNVPVVGKDQVKVHREMQWLRIDTYYSGSPDSPKTSFQPILCQHCDNAPCENVCPVAATNHSPDGLNQQIYNRCVGTRYCSNNCPYKVRRFNFFNYRDHVDGAYYEQEPINYLMNPEVTVRSRGVMEKCTFCIQRIMDEKQHAIEQKRDIDGENVKTACQDACPSYAIEFGDVHNKENKIYKYSEHDLAYHVLEELNVRPNVTYIAKLRNIEPVNNIVEEKKQ